MRRFNLIVLVGVLLVCLLGAWAPPAAAQAPNRYFPETGHSVRDPFIAFFDTTGGLARYGYPITDDYVDPASGLLVQYFQRARLEWHPGNPEPYKIQLGLLGDELGRRTPPIPVNQIPVATDPHCHYFPETGHTACSKFWDYWREQGGLDLLGYPISEYAIENDQIVQYFQRAKLEWHPESVASQRVRLSPLGQIYYDVAQLDRRRLQVAPLSASRGPAISLRARAVVLEPTLPAGGLQTGGVYVSDQLQNPLAGVAVTLIVHDGQGDRAFTLSPTNADGFAFLSFSIGPAMPGTVVPLEFVVTSAGLFAWTRTSYMVWFR